MVWVTTIYLSIHQIMGIGIIFTLGQKLRFKWALIQQVFIEHAYK